MTHILIVCTVIIIIYHSTYYYYFNSFNVAAVASGGHNRNRKRGLQNELNWDESVHSSSSESDYYFMKKNNYDDNDFNEFLFLSENEEEESIIQALSVAQQEQDYDNYNDYDVLYDDDESYQYDTTASSGVRGTGVEVGVGVGVGSIYEDNYYDDKYYDDKQYSIEKETLQHKNRRLKSKASNNNPVRLSQKKLKDLEKVAKEKEEQTEMEQETTFDNRRNKMIDNGSLHGTIVVSDNYSTKASTPFSIFNETSQEKLLLSQNTTVIKNSTNYIEGNDNDDQINFETTINQRQHKSIKAIHSFFQPKSLQRGARGRRRTSKKIDHNIIKTNICYEDNKNSRLQSQQILEQQEATDNQKSKRITTPTTTTSSYAMMMQKNIPVEIPSSIDAIRSRAENNSHQNKNIIPSKASNTNMNLNQAINARHHHDNMNRFPSFFPQQPPQSQQHTKNNYNSINPNSSLHHPNLLYQDINKVNFLPSSNATPTTSTSTLSSTTTSHTSTIQTYLQKQQKQQMQRLQINSSIHAHKESKATPTRNKNMKTNTINPKLPTTMSLTTPWARKFILSRPKDALLPVPRDFLTDGFNLVELAPIVERLRLVGSGGDTSEHSQQEYHQHSLSPLSSVTPSSTPSSASFYPSLYKAALRLILDDNEDNVNIAMNMTSQHDTITTQTTKTSTNTNAAPTSQLQLSPALIQKAAEILYTLVHARYVTSARGLDTIRRMFIRNYEIGTREVVFGRCPRIGCNGNPLLPYGISCKYYFDGDDDTGERVGGLGAGVGVGVNRKSMRYCCSCGEVFHLWESKVDGSAWGPSFCHLFLMTHGLEIFPSKLITLSLSKSRNRSKNSNFISSNDEQLLKSSQHVSKRFLSHDHDDSHPIPKIFGFRIHRHANVNYPFQ